MLYRTFYSNSLKALLLSFVLMLVLWGRVFVYAGAQPLSFEGVGMPLWTALIVPLFGHNAYLAAMFSLLLAFAIGLTLNRLVGRYGWLAQQSMLPLVAYALLVSGFLVVQRLNPVWVFTLFFLSGLERLMGASLSPKPYVRCFDTAVLVSLGSLFYGKGLFFFPVIWVFMGLLRLYSVRSFIATILGLVFPYALSIGYFFLFGKTSEFLYLLLLNVLSNTGQFSYHASSQIYVAILLLLALFSILTLARYLPVQKIITRKHFRVIIWLILLTAATGLTPFFSIELIPVFSLGLAITLSFWLEKIKLYRLKEILFGAFLLITLAAQIFF